MPVYNFNNYFSQLNTKIFKNVTQDIFETIDCEGLTEEYDSYNKSDWKYVEIDLTDQDINGLKKFDVDTINKFNQFDIQLKEKFSMKYVDLIDYDNGKVFIVKSRKQYSY